MTEVEYWRIMVRLDELEAKLNALTALVRFPQGNIAYSAHTTNGDPTKFRSGSISSASDISTTTLNDCAKRFEGTQVPPFRNPNEEKE